MTKKDIKHAIISLVLGVLTMAAYQIIQGLLDIAQVWLSGVVGGTATSVSYLIQKYHT